jgi:hypothetical protein
MLPEPQTSSQTCQGTQGRAAITFQKFSGEEEAGQELRK